MHLVCISCELCLHVILVCFCCCVLCVLFLVLSYGTAVSTQNWLRLDQRSRPHWDEFCTIVYPSTDCTMNGCAWIRGTQPDFQHANKNLVFLKIVSCIFVVSIRASQVPFCYWNVHKIFVVSYKCAASHSQNHEMCSQDSETTEYFSHVLEKVSGLHVDYTSKMAKCSFHVVLQFSHNYYFTEYCCINDRVLYKKLRIISWNILYRKYI